VGEYTVAESGRTGAVCAGSVAAMGGNAGGGDTGTASGAGGFIGDEAGINSSSAGGNTGSKATDGVRETDGKDGQSGGGIAGPDKGERSSWHSPSGPLSSSTSFLRLLVLFVGGIVGDTSAGVGRAAFLQASSGDCGNDDRGWRRRVFQTIAYNGGSTATASAATTMAAAASSS
jgi:hypothetical protein